MLRALILEKLNAEERRLGARLDCLRQILAVSLASLIAAGRSPQPAKPSGRSPVD